MGTTRESHTHSYHPTGPGFNALHGDPKGGMYKETIIVTEDEFGDWHLAAWYPQSTEKRDPNPWWTREGVCHHYRTVDTDSTLPALQENHAYRGQARHSSAAQEERSIKQWILLGDNKTLSKALWQTLEVDIVDLTVGFSTRLWKLSDRLLWRSQLAPKWKKRPELKKASISLDGSGSWWRDFLIWWSVRGSVYEWLFMQPKDFFHKESSVSEALEDMHWAQPDDQHLIKVCCDFDK